MPDLDKLDSLLHPAETNPNLILRSQKVRLATALDRIGGTTLPEAFHTCFEYNEEETSA